MNIKSIITVVSLILSASFFSFCFVSSVYAESPVNSVSNDKLSGLMKNARQAMKEAQYDRAIQTYNELINLPEHAYRRDALELLGLAYERKGDIKQARATYQRYIQLYAKGDGSERVKQRLAGITTATWVEPEKLKALKTKQDEGLWQTFGAFSQYLRRDASRYQSQPEVINQFALISMLDVTSRRRSESLDIKTRLAVSDFLDLEGNVKNEQQLSYAYFDFNQRNSRLSGRLGRQNASGGGVLGRFDGVNLGYQLADKYKLNLVAGMPVERTSDISVDSQRYFYGANLETGLWNEYWEANTYVIEQRAEGYVDRQALGSELRYLHPDINMYTLLDYDFNFNTLNIFSSQGSVTNAANDTYSFIFDYRHAPPITMSNALIGQTTDSLSQLNRIYTEDEMNQLAADRTTRSMMLLLGYSHPVDDNMRWDIDFTMSKLSDTPASGAVAALDYNGVDYYFSSQFTTRNYFRTDDINIVGLGINQTDSLTAVNLMLNSRFSAAQGWYYNPRLRFSMTDYDNGDNQQSIAPGLRVDYRVNRDAIIEFDSGYEWLTQKLWYGDQKTTSYYFDLGYRLDF